MNSPAPMAPLKPQDPVSERAAEFFGQRRFGNWNDADQIQLDAWLAESVLHEVAWLRLQGIAARADRLAALNSIDGNDAAPSAGNKFRYRRFLLRCFAASEDYAQTRRSHLRRRVVLPLLAAASVVLAALWGGPFIASWLAPPDRADSTDVGGRTLLSFADHTQIELNTSTAVRLRMTTGERTVWLEKGEAWFHVAHDAAHPFTVIVGKHRITDLGTEILIRRGADDVDVILLNGRAALSTEGLQTATLAPGEEAVATSATLSVTRKTPQQLSDALAWRRGVLVFRKTKLADVVREFNRYNTTRLVIADPSIADEPISADLKTDQYEEFLQLAQTMLNLRVDREGNEILISRGSRPETKDETRRAVHVKRSP